MSESDRPDARRRSLKASRYNYAFDRDGGGLLLFNSLSGAVIEIGEEERTTVQSLLAVDARVDPAIVGTETLDVLLEGRFLIDGDVDEPSMLKVKFQANKYAGALLNVILALTYDCNFRCVYCGENLRKVTIGPAMLGAVERFCVSRLEQIGFRRFEMGWYGGEPLLCKDEIRRLSRTFLSACERERVAYIASLYTNGYDLDEEFVASLGDLGIGRISLTLDGPAEMHDRRRFLRGGGPTYDRILGNLRRVIERWGHEVKIIVRTNLDAGNVKGFEALVDELREFRGYIRVNYSAVACSSGRGKKYSASCLSGGEYLDQTQDFFSLLEAEGFTGGKPLRPAVGCMGHNVHGYAIDPEGKVYSCIAGLTLQDEGDQAIAHLNENGELVPHEVQMTRWYAWDMFESSECRECKQLPLCLGGCPLPVANTGIHTCHHPGHDDDVERFVKSHYESLRTRPEGLRQEGAAT